MQIPSRTKTTPLTDDELLLFDFLFDKTLAFHHLQRDVYPLHMNCAYSHGLKDAELRDTLNSLVQRGYLHRKRETVYRLEGQSDDADELYSLTESGGALWESERLPDWNRFLCTAHWELGTNLRGMMRVVGIEGSTARMCMGALFVSGIISPTGRMRVRRIFNARLLPWKTFAQVQSVRCKTNDNVHDTLIATDWDAYHAMRCWWRDIHELETLNRKSLQ